MNCTLHVCFAHVIVKSLILCAQDSRSLSIIFHKDHSLFLARLFSVRTDVLSHVFSCYQQMRDVTLATV